VNIPGPEMKKLNSDAYIPGLDTNMPTDTNIPNPTLNMPKDANIPDPDN
jgi:hypothetical protein